MDESPCADLVNKTTDAGDRPKWRSRFLVIHGFPGTRMHFDFNPLQKVHVPKGQPNLARQFIAGLLSHRSCRDA